MPDDGSPVLERIQRVLRSEAEALTRLADQAPAQAAALLRAVRLFVESCGEGRPGRVVATGVGKAGIIARKVAATLASTGTPALFLHPAEARHGDLGMVRSDDVVLAFSNSGSSEELIALLPSLRHIGCALIAVVGDPGSALGRHADVTLDIGRVTEACPLGLAPSASTTAMLALGDALALAVLEARRFTPDQYARFHPGGALGRKLITCGEAMRTGERVPVAKPGATVVEAMRLISQARAGSVLLVDAAGQLRGIFTDGDLRRRLIAASDPAALLRQSVESVATMPCRSVPRDELVQAALRLCAEKKINELPVIEPDGRLAGLLDVQDLVDRGFAAG